VTVHDVAQRSPEWFALRCGRVTGTAAGDMLAKIKTGEAAARRDLRTRLVCERITGNPSDEGNGYQSAEMKWGVEHETAARYAYEALTGELVRPVGFVTHDTLSAGCSPDGEIEHFAGLLEVKCPKSATHLSYLRGRGVPSTYLPQVQHNLFVTGAAWCDFVSFDPRFPTALRLFVARYHLDDAERKAYELLLRMFLGEVQKEFEDVQQLLSGAGVAA
jgi:predicted phage-related endonuclease